MPETVDKSSLSMFFTAYSPQLRLFDFFRTGAFCVPRAAFCLRSPSPRLLPAALLCLFSVSFLLHLLPVGRIFLPSLLRRTHFSAVLCVFLAIRFSRFIFLSPLLPPAFCFLLHFPAAMLALSLRPAILFIYLNYYSYMNTHSLARRFLP